ncbi:MAG: CHASE3 domain-containing protein, partial [Deltaproteobacteria bacterium]|nr:CHASE3 domain-containing protein [Deltaproteobacteria bacterium]
MRHRSFIDALTFRQKAIFLVSAPMVLLLLSSGLAMHMHSQIREAQAWALHSKNVIARGVVLGQLFVGACADLRGYLLTENVYFVEQRAKRVEQIARTLESLSESVSDNAAQSEALKVVLAQKQSYFNWSESVVALARNNDPRALDKFRTLQGETDIRDILNSLDKFLLNEWRLGELRMAQLEKYTQRAQFASVLFLVLGVGTVGVVGWLLSESVLQRFRVLLSRIESFRVDDTDDAPLSGRDEISRLDQAFRTLRRSLVEKTRENEMFVYSVSHDLRAPLVNLRGFGEELRTSIDELRTFLSGHLFSEPEHARLDRIFRSDIGQSLDFISSSVKRLSSIIDSLLRFSRLSRVLYQPRMTSVGETVDHVVSSLRGTIAERGVEVEVRGPLPTVFVDPAVLEQVVANLLENAIKYSDPS